MHRVTKSVIMAPAPKPAQASTPGTPDLAELLKVQMQMMQMFMDTTKRMEANAEKREEMLVERLEKMSSSAGRDTHVHTQDAATVSAALASRILVFEYDEESGCTFDKWITRFEDVVMSEGSSLKESDRTSLLVSKLDSRCYAMYVDHILPKKPADMSYEETKIVLSELFGEKVSLFRRRFNALRVVKEETEDFKSYAARVNQLHERGRVKEMTEDDMKCTLFVAGLQESRWKDLRKRLIRRLEGDTETKLKDLVTECDLSMTLVEDAEVREQDRMRVAAPVHQKKWSHQRSKKFNASRGYPSKNPGMAKDSSRKGACHSCGKFGHWAASCPDSRRKVKAVVKLNKVEGRKNVTVRIGNVDITMQLDTGADVTIIDQKTWRRLGSPSLSEASLDLSAANGSPIKVEGSFDAEFKVKGFQGKGRCYVTKNIRLLGIDWIDQLPPFKEAFATTCCVVKTAGVLEKEIQQKHPDVFKEELGRCKKLTAELVLKKDAKPVFVPKRGVPFAVEELVEKELDRLVDIGVLTPVSYSKWAAPIVVVKKKTGAVRICADYSTGLNDALELNRHPLPTPEEIFTKLNGGVVFSQIDLRDAYLQVEMSEKSKELLTVNTKRGLYQYNRLPFGVKSAPGIFQGIMDNLIAGVDGCAAYLDDIVVCGRTQEEHDRSVRRLFERIEEFGIRVRLEKCSFAQERIKFLGFIVDRHGRRPDPERTSAIAKMPAPRNIQEVESFLGMVSFYSSFVKEMRSMRAPLDDLKKKDNKFVWTDECEVAFNKLKQTVDSDLLLCHYDPKLPIIVAADASEKGLGAVITHRYPNGTEKAICHASRALTSAEKNYSQTEKEGLALIFAVRKFHRYIYGRKFTLLTDHRPLLGIYGSKKGIPAHSANRLQRWSLTLLGYDFDIQYRRTTEFGQADALSRLIASHTPQDEDVVIAKVESDVSAVLEETVNRLPVSWKDIRDASERDYVLPGVVDALKSGKWPDCMPGSALYNFRSQESHLTVKDNCVFFGERIVVPRLLRGRILKMLHSGHPGQTRMKLLARSYVYWIGMDTDIERTVRGCECCQRAAKMLVKTELTPWPETNRAMERIHIDFAGPQEGKMYLVVVDAYSRWPEIVEMRSTTATATINQLECMFARFGYPDTLVSDNGSQFTSRDFEEYCRVNGIKHLRSSPFHPQSNGLAERFVDTFKRALLKMKGEGSSQKALQRFLMTYRSTPCPSAKNQQSPAEMFIGRKLTTQISRLVMGSQEAKKGRLQGSKTKMAENFNRQHGAKKRSFNVDDLVYARDHRTPSKPSWTAGRVVRIRGRSMYDVEISKEVVWTRHVNQLRPRHCKEAVTILCDEFDIAPPSDGNGRRTVVDADVTSDWPSDLYRAMEDHTQRESSSSSSSSPARSPRGLRRSTRARVAPKRLSPDPSKDKY